MKIPVKSRFLWAMIDGRKYISIINSKNVIALVLPF